MKNDKKTNRLSVYLIKKEYSDISAILKNADALESRSIDGVGNLYFGESHPNPPSWLKSFFGGIALNVSILNSSSKAILIARVTVKGNTKRLFAIPFGHGWSLMNEGIWEERFGLKVTLNTVNPSSLRSIEKQNMSSVPKHTTEQMSRDGEVGNFGIDIEQDLVRSVTGGSTSEKFGKTLTGKDALSVSVKVDLSNIVEFLRDCWTQYTSDHYKKDFGFIDQIAELKDPRLLARLNDALINNINTNELEKTWMAVPEIIDWENVKGFKYSPKKDDLKDDIHIRQFLETLPEKKKTVEIETLKTHKVYCLGAASDDLIHSWRVYDCIYCEIVDDQTKNVYLLSNGKWYQVETEFAAVVNKEYKALRDAAIPISLPSYAQKDEYEYNKAVAVADPSFCCMDRKIVSHGGGYSKVEFCDLFSNKRQIVHVKQYGGSSVLSHLFSQGVVSGELFLADADFRHNVNDQLVKSHKLPKPQQQPIAKDYEIVFAIISKSAKQLDLPFFSKVSFRNARRRLETYGYKVSFQKIEPAGLSQSAKA